MEPDKAEISWISQITALFECYWLQTKALIRFCDSLSVMTSLKPDDANVMSMKSKCWWSQLLVTMNKHLHALPMQELRAPSYPCKILQEFRAPPNS